MIPIKDWNWDEKILKSLSLWWEELPVHSNWTNLLAIDAWWTPMSSSLISLFRWMFTYNIPHLFWKEYLNWTELIDITNSTSVWWALKLQSTTWNTSMLISKRAPLYQPNRWHRYSVSAILPTPLEAWTQVDFWLWTTDNVVCFRVTDTWINWVRISNWVEVESIPLTLPDWFDKTKWNLFDIRFQWRWVGNYEFYINLELVWTMSLLWTLSWLSIENPAMPALFSVQWNTELLCWCVDISSEWWTSPNYSHWFVKTPVWLINTTNTIPDWTCALAIRIPNTFKWKVSARDVILWTAISFVKDEHELTIYRTRDQAVLWWITTNADPLLWWASPDEDTILEYMIWWTWTLLETTFQANRWASTHIHEETWWREEIDRPNRLILSSNDSKMYFSAWDYLIAMIKPDWASKLAWVTLSYSEAI